MSSGDIYNPNSPTSQIFNQDYLSNTEVSNSSINYIYPRQVGTGSTRGTQTIGVGNINIDGSNDQITLSNNANTASINIGQQLATSTQTGVATSSLSTSTGAFGISITDNNKASINLGISSNNTTELLFNDGTTNRLLIGQNNLNQEVIWISKPGVDVTAATVDQLIFNSNQDIFKIVTVKTLELTLTLSGTPTQSSVTLAHGLSFLPGYIAFINVDPSWNAYFGTQTNNGPNPFIVPVISAGFITSVLYCSVTVDATNIYFQVVTSLTGTDVQSYSTKVYLLQESFSS